MCVCVKYLQNRSRRISEQKFWQSGSGRNKIIRKKKYERIRMGLKKEKKKKKKKRKKNREIEIYILQEICCAEIVADRVFLVAKGLQGIAKLGEQSGCK